MNNPNDEKKPIDKPSDAAPETRSFFYGGSFFKEIRLVLVAGFAFAAFQWGGDMMDRLARWIDGEEMRPTAAIVAEAPETPNTDTGAVVAVAEKGLMTKAADADNSVFRFADFRLNTDKSWLVERMPGRVRPHPYFKNLLNPTLAYTGPNSPLLPGVPDSYLIELPDDAGQIILLSKAVIINKKLSPSEIIAAREEFGPNGFAVLSVPSGSRTDRATPLSIEKDAPFVFNGNVDPNLISENDLFDHYFLEQITIMRVLENTHGEIDLKRLRRRTINGYEIGEVDYIIGPGTLRLTAVFYWHRQEQASWGEFGLFLALRREPVARKHRRMFETVSTLRLMDGERQIWRGLNYEAPAEAETGAFVHLELSGRRMQAFGLTTEQVERKVWALLPISTNDLEDAVILTHGDSKLRLRDVAKTNLYSRSNDDMLHTPESIILTVGE